MVLRRKSRLGLAIKGDISSYVSNNIIHNYNIEILELSCFFMNEIADIALNLKKFKKMKESLNVAISIHAPPIINIKNDKVSYTFSENLRWIYLIAKELNLEWITVHGFVVDRILREYERKYWLIDLKNRIDNFPIGIKKLILIENGFGNIFPKQSDEFNFLKRKLILDVAHAYIEGGQRAIKDLINCCKPQQFHISDVNDNSRHISVGEGKINFSFIKKTGMDLIIEAGTIDEQIRSLQRVNFMLHK